MKKLLVALISFLMLCGFSSKDFDINNLKDYHKEYKTEDVTVCSSSSVKTYMSYQAITNTASKQYEIISQLTIDETTGFLYDEDGFIATALGANFGELGSRYYFTLSSGVVIPVIKADAKSISHVPNGCATDGGSVIEFIIDEQISKEYFGQGPSGLASFGNFNNDPRFEGTIVKVEKVLDEKVEEGITYVENDDYTNTMHFNDITY
ncbi:MAG: hypothetical protein MR210_09180 [Erysipelotrichaceae bacterium]|nr:hypothetical protein [Erysipelotrichaceae bacterium]MDY5252976.1 hypothetical protein [Erysipelotrichaceae bacterium]